MSTVGSAAPKSKKLVSVSSKKATTKKAAQKKKPSGITSSDAFDVHSVRSAGVPVASTVATKHISGIPQEFPLNALEKIDGRGRSGDVFFLDGGTLRDMKINIRRVVDEGEPGFEILFRVMHTDQEKLEKTLEKKGGTTGPIKFRGAEQQGGATVYNQKVGTVNEESSYSDSQVDSDDDSWMLTAGASKGGTIEFAVPGSAHAMRGLVRLNLRGDDKSCEKQLAGMLNEFGLQHAFSPPSAASMERYKLMRLLWQNDHSGAEKLSRQGKLDQLKTPDLKKKLKAAGVNDAEMKAVHFSDVAPSHFTVVNPAQFDKMVEAGARYLYSTCSSPEHVATILEGGQKSSLRRYQDGLIIDGMSTQDDFSSGGGAGVFTRLVTQDAILEGESWNGRRYRMMLRPEILARTDWFGHSGDEYGRAYDLGSSNFGTDLVEEVAGEHSSWGSSYQSDNEIIFRDAIGPQYIAHITAGNDSDRNALIKELKSRNFKPYDGSSLEDFVVLAPSFIQFGPQPEIKDVKKFVADAKSDAEDNNTTKLKWFLTFGPICEERAELEAEILTGNNPNHRDELFGAIKQSGELAMDKAQLEKIAVDLETPKKSDDDDDYQHGYYSEPADAQTLERFTRNCAQAVLKLDSDVFADILGKQTKTQVTNSLSNAEWVDVIETLAPKGTNEPSKSFELAMSLSEDKLLKKADPGFWRFCEANPRVSPTGPAWFTKRLKSLDKKASVKDIQLFIAQTKSLEEIGDLQLRLVENGSQRAKDLLDTTLQKFDGFGCDPAALGKAVQKLSPQSKMRPYLSQKAPQAALIKTGDEKVLQFLEKRWAQKNTRPNDKGWLEIIGALGEANLPAARGWAVAQAAPKLIAIDQAGPGSLHSLLAESDELFKVSNEASFIKSALKQLGTKSTQDEGATKLAWLYARGSSETRSAVFEATLRDGVKGKGPLLEWFLRHSPSREIPLAPNALVDLALEFDKSSKPEMNWLLKNGGRQLLTSGSKSIAEVIEKRQPHQFGVDRENSLSFMRSLIEAGGSSNPHEQVVSWLLKSVGGQWLSSDKASTYSTLRELEIYPEDIGLETTEAIVSKIRNEFEDQLDDFNNGYIYSYNSDKETPVPDDMPAKYQWMIKRGGDAVDDDIVNAILTGLPKWQEDGGDSWEPFLTRLHDMLPAKWNKKIAKVEEKLSEW